MLRDLSLKPLRDDVVEGVVLRQDVMELKVGARKSAMKACRRQWNDLTTMSGLSAVHCPGRKAATISGKRGLQVTVINHVGGPFRRASSKASILKRRRCLPRVRFFVLHWLSAHFCRT